MLDDKTVNHIGDIENMPRGLFAGMTDYSHQTFRDILDDLNNWRMNLISTTETINTIVKQLQESGYWKKVPDDFSSLVMYALKYYKTSTTEISDIIQNLEIEVQENHISRLRSLAKTADELNLDFGQVWHRQYESKDYGELNFSNVEKIYSLGRNMVVDMLDLSNVAARLEDFVGMKNGNGKQRASKKYMVPILIFLLGIAISIVSNVASSVLPPSFQPYYWLSWPLLGILTIVSIFLLIKH